jgi:hypothetical protein
MGCSAHVSRCFIGSSIGATAMLELAPPAAPFGHVMQASITQ